MPTNQPTFEADENTTVVIVGAGIAGLTLGNFLLHSGINCVILEQRSREYVEQRQRAGVIDTRATRMFRAWGLEDRVVGGVPTESALNFRIDGQTRALELDSNDHGDGRFCPQQVLVRNLIDVFLSDGGDLRFDAEVSVENLAGDERPLVRYRDSTGSARVISCEFIAGCDGDRGVSRAAIPDEILTRHSHEYGYAWLTILAEVPADHQSMMALHPRGFAGQFARGPHASRFYLQCPLGTPQWTNERIWDELETRFGEPMSRGPISSTQLVPLRSVVYDPMSYGRLYLLGDAAHIAPPMSAKGMNLALHDAEVFANAVVRYRTDHDSSLLDTYSSTCLAHVWNYQAFATWWTELVHNAADASHQGEFRHRIARADLARLFESGSANRLFSEFIAGLN
ncbi:4-hydroxybenzoate 3-monooxygenase [Nocardia sp. NPDC004278]